MGNNLKTRPSSQLNHQLTDILLEKCYLSQIFLWKNIMFHRYSFGKNYVSHTSTWKNVIFHRYPLGKCYLSQIFHWKKCYVSQIFSWKNVMFHRYSLGKMLSFTDILLEKCYLFSLILTLLTDHTLSISSVSHARCSFHFFPSQSNCCHHFPLHLVESHCTERS